MLEEFQVDLEDIVGQRFGIEEDFFRERYDKFGPHAMLAVLDKNPLCHAEAHSLGRIIYERTGDLAIATDICKNQCSGGCIHGVLMGMFSEATTSVQEGRDDHVSAADLTPALRSEIATTCDTSEIVRYTGEGNCYHAVGHALMALADYDIEDGVALCEDIFKKKGLGAVYYCATGIYMERDIEFGEKDALVSDQYPCDASRYPAACFRYKLRRIFDFSKEHKVASVQCLRLAGIHRRGCFHGLGFGAADLIRQTPSAAAHICSSGDSDDKRMCLEGAFGYINIYSRATSRRACESFEGDDRAICERATLSENFGMNRDFEFYVR